NSKMPEPRFDLTTINFQCTGSLRDLTAGLADKLFRHHRDVQELRVSVARDAHAHGVDEFTATQTLVRRGRNDVVRASAADPAASLYAVFEKGERVARG